MPTLTFEYNKCVDSFPWYCTVVVFSWFDAQALLRAVVSSWWIFVYTYDGVIYWLAIPTSHTWSSITVSNEINVSRPCNVALMVLVVVAMGRMVIENHYMYLVLPKLSFTHHISYLISHCTLLWYNMAQCAMVLCGFVWHYLVEPLARSRHLEKWWLGDVWTEYRHRSIKWQEQEGKITSTARKRFFHWIDQKNMVSLSKDTHIHTWHACGTKPDSPTYLPCLPTHTPLVDFTLNANTRNANYATIPCCWHSVLCLHDFSAKMFSNQNDVFNLGSDMSLLLLTLLSHLLP